MGREDSSVHSVLCVAHTLWPHALNLYAICLHCTHSMKSDIKFGFAANVRAALAVPSKKDLMINLLPISICFFFHFSCVKFDAIVVSPSIYANILTN